MSVSSKRLDGGFTEKGFQFFGGFRVGQQLLPALVVLLAEKETGKIGDLGLLLRRQRPADADNFFRRSAHSPHLTEMGEHVKCQLSAAQLASVGSRFLFQRFSLSAFASDLLPPSSVLRPLTSTPYFSVSAFQLLPLTKPAYGPSHSHLVSIVRHLLVRIETKLNRLLPAQCSENLAGIQCLQPLPKRFEIGNDCRCVLAQLIQQH